MQASNWNHENFKKGAASLLMYMKQEVMISLKGFQGT